MATSVAVTSNSKMSDIKIIKRSDREKRAEEIRRGEVYMLDILIERYPEKAVEKLLVKYPEKARVLMARLGMVGV